MNQLININQNLTMSSREIAKLINKEHANIKISAERLAEKGIISTLASQEFEHNGNLYTEYLLNKRDSLILVAQNSPKFTAALVDRWQELESNKFVQLPQTYAAALLEAGRLALEVEAQAKQLEQQKPQIEFANDVANTCDSISIGGYAGLLASSGYHIGQNRLFAWLRNKGYLTTRKNRPSIQAIEAGWFKWIETTYICPRTGLPKISGQATITGKGQIYLRKKLIKELGDN